MAEKLVLAKDYEDPKHWWQNPKFWGSVAAILLAMSTIAGQYVALNTLSEIRDTKGTFEDLSQIAEANQDTLDSINKANTILVECTTPSVEGDSHECFDDSQARTAEAVAIIVDAVIFVAECEAEGAPDVQACVYQKIGSQP